jgi:two-component sensor histidine kinase
LIQINAAKLGCAHQLLVRALQPAGRASKGGAMRPGFPGAVSLQAERLGAMPPIIDPPDVRDDRLLAAEADHRIANHLALLTGYVRLKAAALASQAEEPSRASMNVLLEGVGAQINAVARLHRILSSAGEAGSANLGEHLHEICAGFATGVSGGTEIVEDLSPICVIRRDQFLPLGQIVAEVITNAVKHADPAGLAGRVLVGCREDDRGEVLIEVSDAGPGLPAAFDPETDEGLGFGLLRALGRQIGARIEFLSTRHGLHFRLTLPAPAAQAVAGDLIGPARTRGDS